MPKGVPVVEDFSVETLFEITRNYSRLNGYGSFNKFQSDLLRAAHIRQVFPLKKLENSAVRDESTLDNFGQPSGKIAIGKRRQPGGVDENSYRRVKCANQILSVITIDSSLSTNCCINHSCNSCRDSNPIKTSEPTCCKVPGEVSDCSPTYSYDKI